MSGHTPGPWHVQDDHGKRWIETSGNDDTIAEIHRRNSKGSVYSCKEANANARLIAAAPDLLAALEYLLAAYVAEQHSEFDFPNDEWSAEGRDDEYALKAMAAIARAKGERP